MNNDHNKERRERFVKKDDTFKDLSPDDMEFSLEDLGDIFDELLPDKNIEEQEEKEKEES